MIPVLRSFGRDESFAKVGLVQDRAEHLLTLLEDLVSMGNEEEPLIALGSEPLEVERGDPCLPSSCRRHDKVPEVTTVTFGAQRFKDLDLEWFRRQID